MSDSQVVDCLAVSHMFDVKLNTVYQWRSRGVLPEPAGYVGGQAYWFRGVLTLWGAQTGRRVVDHVLDPYQDAKPSETL